MSTIKERLEPLRGMAYHDEWNRIWLEIRDEAIEAIGFLRLEAGYSTVENLVELADMLGTPFKPLIKSLESEGLLEPGFYEDVYADGFTLTRARELIADERETTAREERKGSLTPIEELLQDGIEVFL